MECPNASLTLSSKPQQDHPILKFGEYIFLSRRIYHLKVFHFLLILNAESDGEVIPEVFFNNKGPRELIGHMF